MKVRLLIALGFICLTSSVASAQVTLTDPASGISLTVDGAWSIVDSEGAAVAVNEEGCMLVLSAVPAAEAEAAVADLDAFVSSFIQNPVVAEAGPDETGMGFGAYGTGMVEGEGVGWIFAGGVEGDFFGMVFAVASETATVCSAEIDALLGSM